VQRSQATWPLALEGALDVDLNPGLCSADTGRMRRVRAYRSSGLLRSLTLLRSFVLASAVILAAGAVALSSTLSKDLREQALEDNARDVALYVDAVLAPNVVREDRVVVTPLALERLARTVRQPGDIRGINVWSQNGRLRLSTTQPGRVGRRVTSGPDFRRTLRTGRSRAELVRPTNAKLEVVKVWTPLLSRKGRPVGAAEVTLDERVVDDVVAGSTRTIWLAVGIVFGLLWLTLGLLVGRASSRLKADNEERDARSRELTDSTRRLEQSLLETIETLNAAVEARDPYTAGHSQRVRRVALAIGRDMRLNPKQLGALGAAALFHDVGKIGMPDSILTKPQALSRGEAAVMREHVTRGAEIVSRCSSLQDSVPAIRHHHERWDGLGYPDGLSGEEIPIEAAIIALADAWDAMTTDRPYAAALPTSDAMLQIRAGREKQFNPSVVDTFLAVARRRPADVVPPEAPATTAAVL
jgi:putative nucleotidyltransferase with HDIG domain